MFSLIAPIVLLALLRPHLAAGVAVSAPSKGGGKGKANLKEFTIDLVNNALAPDGHLRSGVCLFCMAVPELTLCKFDLQVQLLLTEREGVLFLPLCHAS